MSAGAIKAGEAYVRITANNDMLQSGLKRAQAMLTGFAKTGSLWGSGLIGAGSAIVGSLAGVAIMAGSLGGRLKDASDRTGIAVDVLAELDYAAVKSASSLDGLVGGVFKMQKALASVSKNSDPFADLGLSVEQLKAMKPDEAFIAVAKAVARIKEPTERNIAAMSIFGKGASELAGLFAAGSDGIDTMLDDFKRLRLAMDPKDILAADQFDDTIETIGMQIKRTMFSVGVAIAKAVQPYLTLLSEGIAVVTKFVDEHRDLAVTIGLAGGALIAAGGVLLALAAGATVVSAAIGGVIGIVSVVGTVLGGVVAVVTALLSPMALVGSVIGVVGSVIAAIVSPVGLAIASIGVLSFAVGEAGFEFFAFSATAKAMVGKVMSYLTPMVGFVKDVFKGIGNALAAGDLPLAGRIAMLGLEIAFIAGKDAVLGVWSSLSMSLLTLWAKTSAEIQSIWNAMIGSVASSIVGLYIGDGEMQARADKLRKGAAFFEAEAKKSDDAGDTVRAEQQRNNARVMMQNAAKEDPKAARLAAAQMTQRMTQDNQGNIDAALKQRMAELEARGKGDSKAMDERRKAMADALAELQKARDKADTENWRGKGTLHGQGVKGRQFPKDQVAEIPGMKNTAIGAFSGMQLAAQSNVIGVYARIAKATEDTADNTATIAGKIGGTSNNYED